MLAIAFSSLLLFSTVYASRMQVTRKLYLDNQSASLCGEPHEGDEKHILGDYGLVTHCGIKTHDRRCAIINGEKKCVCKHEGTWFHGELRRYILKENHCVNKHKWWHTHLTEEELSDLRTLTVDGVEYHSAESVKMHEVATILHDNTAVDKWDAAQCQKLMVQGAELALGMGILAGNMLVIAGLAGASVPVFGIPAILTIVVVSLGVMAWNYHLNDKEKRLKQRYHEFVTKVQRVILGLDSVNVIIKKQNALIAQLRSLNVDKVNKFLGSEIVKEAADPHNQLDKKNMFYTGFGHDYELTKKDAECRGAIEGRKLGDASWMQITDIPKRAVCGTVKLLESMHTLGVMFGNAVKTQFDDVKLPEEVDGLIQELSEFWKLPRECRGGDEAFKSKACQKKVNDPAYIRRRKQADHQLHNLHRLNMVIKVVGLATGVGAFAAHSALEAIEAANGVKAAKEGVHAVEEAYAAKQGVHAVEEAYSAKQGVHAVDHVVDSAHAAHAFDSAHAIHAADSDWSVFLKMEHGHVQGLSHGAHSLHKASEIMHEITLGEETREGLFESEGHHAEAPSQAAHEDSSGPGGPLCMCE